MSSRLVIDIDSALMEIEALAKRAKVMIEDVQQTYFGKEIKDTEEMWKLAPPWYTVAGIKTDIANGIVFDMMEQLKALRELTDKIA
ncbi:MAG: hypothetical protein ACLRZZ_18945 [Enterocloster sp.]